MKTYIALLRGINVGGHKKVPMATLRESLTKVKLVKVRTYIQSGNVIFQSSEDDVNKLEDIIKKCILNDFGFEVSVIVKSPDELKIILNECPFPKGKLENSFFIIFNKIPDEKLLENAQKISYENEEVIIKKDVLYFHCSTGYGKAKFNMNTYERKLKVTGTARNYNTMIKLLSLANETD